MDCEFTILKGKILKSISKSDDELIFNTSEGEIYRLKHYQDCCESVYIEDIAGELEWLIGEPILLAEERISDTAPPPIDEYEESYTWTFYELATIKGAVTIRWYGTSNGYYSESVDFEKIV